MRYLALSATAAQHDRDYGMMGAVDELWHTFVIFTREYESFCQKVAGRFMHHVPDSEDDAGRATLERYTAFLADYEKVYGEAPNPVYWPSPGTNGVEASSLCGGCRGCNRCGGNCTLH